MNIIPSPEAIKAAATAFLATPGDQPGQDQEQAWAEWMMTAAMSAAAPLYAEAVLRAAAAEIDLDHARGYIMGSQSATEAASAWLTERANDLRGRSIH